MLNFSVPLVDVGYGCALLSSRRHLNVGSLTNSDRHHFFMFICPLVA